MYRGENYDVMNDRSGSLRNWVTRLGKHLYRGENYDVMNITAILYAIGLRKWINVFTAVKTKTLIMNDRCGFFIEF